jgi:hypothetical protein
VTTIEARPYGPDTAPAELEVLRARVRKVADRIFLYEEVPIQTTFTLDLLFDRLEELADGLDRFAYIVDLRGVKRPGAEVRERLKQRVKRLNPRLAHVGIVVGNDVVIRAVAKLAAFAIGFRSFTSNTSVEDAVEACRRALG